MRSVNKFLKFFGLFFSPEFYHFIALNTYTGFHRYLFLKKIRKQFPGTIIPEDLIILNPSQIKIGKKTIISSGCSLVCNELPHPGSITVGDQVILGCHTSLFAGSGKIIIENNVDIGLNVVITTQSRSLKQNPISEPVNFAHEYGEIIIGEGTLVASNVTILSGSTLGKFCNIAAGAVVQGKYPDYTTLAGNPARPLPRIKFNHE